MIPDDSTFHLVLRLRGGGEQHDPNSTYQARSFIDGDNYDLLLIATQQYVDGYWSSIPDDLENDNKDDLVQKVTNWSKPKKYGELKDSVVATVFCLLFLIQFKKEKFEMWKLIYAKGIDWLKSIDVSIDWDKLIKLL